MLEKELQEKRAVDEASEYERAKREVREEAQKPEVNVDILHEKLVSLENVARRTGHPNKEKLAMTLGRFHAHKSRPSFVAALVLKLVSTKDEESILDKEQKLMKSFGIDLKGGQSLKQANAAELSNFSNFRPFGWGYGNHFTFDGPPSMGGVGNPAVPPYVSPQRSAPRGRYNTSFRQCFRCNRSDHLVRNCPLNNNK